MIVARQIQIHRVLRAVGIPLAVLLGYDVAVTAAYVLYGQRWLGIGELPLSLIGSAVAFIVGLRNNLAYNRWWEARTLWGAVVNGARPFARGVSAMVEDEAARRALITLQIAYAQALRLSLWRQDPWQEMAALLPPAVLDRVRDAANLPTALQAEMAVALREAGRAGALDPIRLTALDRVLGELTNAQGGLERIRNTPLPRQFDHGAMLMKSAYCLLLPIGLVSDLGLATPLGSTLIGFAFYALDQIGRDLEDPFDGSVHNVPMQAMTRSIEIDLRRMAGLPATLAPLAPVDGVLA